MHRTNFLLNLYCGFVVKCSTMRGRRNSNRNLTEPSTSIRRCHLCFCFLLALVVCLAAYGQNRGNQANAKEEVVAVVNGRTLTRTEAGRKVRLRLHKLEDQIYRVLRGSLELLINETLVEEEARGQSLTVMEYRRNLLKKARISDEELDDIYRRLHGATMNPEVRNRLRKGIEQNRQRELWQNKLKELRAKAEIQIFLEAPKPASLDVQIQGRPTLGNPNAPVTIVEYADFQCQHCKASQPILKQLLRDYGDNVRLVFKHMPLSRHPHALRAAEASECAAEQNHFWEYHDLIFKNAEELSETKFTEMAAGIGLDVEAFDKCLSSGWHRQQIANDLNDARIQGFTATPTFLVNGQYLSGRKTLEEFKKTIDVELKKMDKE